MLIARAIIKVDNSRTLASDQMLEALRGLLAKELGQEVTLRRDGTQVAILSVGYDVTATMTASGINVSGYSQSLVTEVKNKLQSLAIKLAIAAQNSALIAAVQKRYAGTTVKDTGTKLVVTIPV